MSKHLHLPLILGLLMTASAAASETSETAEKLGQPVERHLSPDQSFQRWAQDPQALDSERGDQQQGAELVHAGHLPPERRALRCLGGAPFRQKISGSMVSG